MTIAGDVRAVTTPPKGAEDVGLARWISPAVAVYQRTSERVEEYEEYVAKSLANTVATVRANVSANIERAAATIRETVAPGVSFVEDVAKFMMYAGVAALIIAALFAVGYALRGVAQTKGAFT